MAFKVSGKLQRCFKKVSRMSQGCFKGVSRKFQGGFKKDWNRVLSGCQVWNMFYRKFQGSFKQVSRKHWRIEGCSEIPLKVIQGSFRESKRSSNCVSKVLKEVSRNYQVCFTKIKATFKGVSEMFHWSFVLQFCYCMTLIAATRAKGGLVFKVLGSNLEGPNVLIWSEIMLELRCTRWN